MGTYWSAALGLRNRARDRVHLGLVAHVQMRVRHTAGGRREDYHRRAAVIEVIRRGGCHDDALVPARVLVVYDRDLAGGKRNGERGVIADGGHGFDGCVWKLPCPTYIGQCEQKMNGIGP
jgi:hypothetical protein